MEELCASPVARGEALDLFVLVKLAERLGIALDLWPAQNRAWDWVKRAGQKLDGELLRRLAVRLFFDEEALLRRATRRGPAVPAPDEPPARWTPAE